MITKEILELLAAGAGFLISAEGKSKSDLLRIAAQAAASKRILVIEHVNHKPLSDLAEIAAEGAGVVVFDLTE